MATHLIILQHGLHGERNEFRRLQKQLTDTFGEHAIIYYSFINFARRDTHRGIRFGAERLVKLLKEQDFKKTHPTLQHVSFVGYSLGALYVRCALGILDQEEWFTQNELQPAVFLSIAGPNLGICSAQSSTILWKKLRTWHGMRRFVDFLGDRIAPIYIGRSGTDLLYQDEEKIVLLLSQSPYIDALAKFKHHVLFYNRRDDWRVPVFSGSINHLADSYILREDSNYDNIQEACTNLQKINWERVEFDYPSKDSHMLISQIADSLSKIVDILSRIAK